MPPLLELSALKVYFYTQDGVVKAVDGVSYSVNAGKTLGVVGESGCGKTVSAMAILRLISQPGKIVGGSIMFEGQDLTKIPEAKIRQVRGNRISMIFQEPMTALNPVFTIGNQIAEAVRLHRGASKQEAYDAAIKTLEKVGIPSPAKRVHEYPHQLSGGMRQRAMIAMALVLNPKLVIADEPTTALDV
ncbi:Oligopeptide transport ATP-binding protein OppD (TC 3.A.1.5.1), partial [hydrothermal vent metagenome]